MSHNNLDHKNGSIINENYFDMLSPKFEDNCCFYSNLKNYINMNQLNHSQRTIEECVDQLFVKMNNKMDFKSDFDELFVQVYDQDIICNDMICTKVLILLYDKLNILDKMEDETIYEFICTCTFDRSNDHGSMFDENIEIIRKNQEDMLKFITNKQLFKKYQEDMLKFITDKQ
jgi:hypothetical protein